MAVTEAGVRGDEDALRYYGSVIIEWPAKAGDGSRPLCGWGCSIFDAATGRQVMTAEKISIPAVTARAQDVITCWLTMFADADGNPVMELPRGPVPGHPGHGVIIPAFGEDGQPRTGLFPFQVTEMRVRQPSEPVPPEPVTAEEIASAAPRSHDYRIA